ncbi:MAG TPA: NBR1-Ig-like domain-containing protein, partial [Candidatus Dormibacteraeota bacterium]|nr:NBR1-Ig-like domain-containing protein [Candidatus Dormibacteraeota bacterium]
EASHFWSVASPHIKGDGKSIMPMLDMEASALSGHVGASSVSDWVNQWCIAVSNSAYAAGLVIKPVIYVSECNANAFDNTVSQWTPWIAHYSGNDPQTSTPWTSPCTSTAYNHWGSPGWVVWQYTSTGGFSGIPSVNVDHDVFDGTASQLSSIIIAGDAASVASSSVPTGVLPGQVFTASITLKNEGTTTWTNTGVNAYKLGSQSPQDNTTWGMNRVLLPTSPVVPGQSVTFNFPATAPAVAGSYTFAWKMVQEGVQWFGTTFSQTINVGNSSSLVSASVPTIVTNGQTFTASITLKNNGGTIWTNTGATPYRLGSQSAQDNTTWGTNRAWMASSPINPSNNVTFTFTAKAPASIGTYAFAWKMLQEPSSYFGATFTTNISVVLPGPGVTMTGYTVDTNMDSTSRNGSYLAYTDCSGQAAWYSFGIPESGSNCTVFDRDIRWMPAMPSYGFTGRGFLSATALIPATGHAKATANFFAVDAVGNDLAGISGPVNECPTSCTLTNFYANTVNITSFGGFRSNTKDDGPPGPAGGCSLACGTFPVAYSQMHIQAARWQYINDWTCIGGYASSSVSDTANRSFSEANLYLYPALDNSHGNTIGTTMGLNGKDTGRVTTGDCNNSNSLDFKGNANAYGGGDNMDGYGFAWVFSPTGATPKLVIGSDDGNRLWVNGVLKNDTNATRSLTRDQDQTAGVTLPAGWNRILLKVHNFTTGFQGTVSLRNGTNVSLNAPSINAYDFGGYYSYGLGYEQDDWYPQTVVSNFYGVAFPANGAAFYGTNGTVSANGSSSVTGPVPYWRTMQYQWGYGLTNADTDYADVSGTPTSASWSHSVPGVSGHRRFYFFAVSRSGRTSFQNNGVTGGSVFADSGNYGRYYDVYVDNLPPLDPAPVSVASNSTTQLALQWLVPLDQGVNVDPGASESAGAAGNLETQNWYRVGDVGVQLYRNGAVISSWGTGTTMTDSGLAPNTPYTYTVEARDNNTSLRGNWHNPTGQQATNILWTLSLAPVAASISADQTNVVVGSNVTWTAIGGFGPGTIQYYRFVWDQNPTHSFTDTEPQWSAGTLATAPPAEGTWYLHVKGYNGADVGNGTYDYAINATQPVQTQPQILSIVNTNGIVTIVWSAASGSVYRVQYTPELTLNPWSNLVPDVQATNSTATATDDPGADVQRFYRVMLLP